MVIMAKRFRESVHEHIQHEYSIRKLRLTLSFRIVMVVVRMKRYGPNLHKR